MRIRYPWRRPGAARSAGRPDRYRLPARYRITALAGAALLACGGLAAGAAAPAASAATSASSPGSTLRIEADTSISTFNPFLSYFDGELNVLGSIYPTLTMITEQGKPAPYLATSWTTSPDHLTWTFKIRSGLKWSDGKPLTAADAAWTFNLIMHNQVAATSNGSLVANFATVTAPNPTTLVITTKKPQANMLYISVPVTGIPIVPEHVWASQVPSLGKFKNMTFPVVGYGPWILAGNVANQYTTLKANKHFFMGAPKYSTLIMQYFSNSDAAVAALRSGQLDVIDDLTATQYQGLKGNKKLTLSAQASNSWVGLELNPGAKTRTGRSFGNGSPALHDPRVREAIALAINRKTLVTKVINGLGVPGAGYLPPAYPQWWWNPPAGIAENYDPAKANQILDSAGYKRGAGGFRTDPRTHKPLTLRLGIHSDESSDAQIAPYLQEWLQAIGVKVQIQSMSFNALNAALPKGTWDMLMDGWGTGPDPTYLLSIQTCATLPLNNMTGGNTDAFFCDKNFDKLFQQQVGDFTVPQRTQTIDQMQQILYQANVDIMLYYQDSLGAVRSDHVSDFFYGHASGQGFWPGQDTFINWRTATPVAAASSSSSSAAVWIVVIIVVVVVLAGAGLVIWRRRTAGERE